MNESVKVLAWDGYGLSATCFKPEAPNGRVILINSATGVKQTYYRDFASYLSTQGFHVYTYDYRGIGASRPSKMKSIKSDMHDWAVLDMDAVISLIMSRHRQSKLVIIGHSVGGQLIGFSRLAKMAESFIMVGAQTPYIGNYEGRWMKLKLWAFWNLILPFFTAITGYFPAKRLGLFEDLPKNVATQWRRWARSHHYAFDDYPEARSSFSSLEQRTLVISFTDDRLAPKKAVDDLLGFYHRLRVDHRHFSPDELLQRRVGHFGFFRKSMKLVLWSEVSKWIQQSMTVTRTKAA